MGPDPPGILRWPTERSREWICRLLDRATSEASVLAVVAVGSAVRPNVLSADLDLIVICKDAVALGERPPLEIDLLAYLAADLNGLIGSGHDLLGWAVKFGRVLFQRDQFWDRLVELWRDRLPLPSAMASRGRAARAHRRLRKVLELGDADAGREQALSYLTHLARAELLARGVYPASRPELGAQLRAIGNRDIAEWIERFARNGLVEPGDVDRLLRLFERERS